jgi:hypothetical protein
MKYNKNITFVLAAAAALILTGCGTVDATYQSTKGIGQSAIGGVGNVVGNSSQDVGKGLGLASDTAGKLVGGAGKVVGGTIDMVGGLVKGTSDIVAPAPTAPAQPKP